MTTETAASSPTVTTAPATRAPAPTTTAASVPGAAAAPEVDRTYSVRTATRTFVDPSRATSANGAFAGAPDRTLPVTFWLPDGSGPFPLVVFSHGYAVTPDFYAPMLERWAAAGYVVAAPDLATLER